jgi:hypothetical protein
MPENPTESALDNVRVEWISSTFGSDGIPRVPTNPTWNRFSDYHLRVPAWSGDAGTEGQEVAGQGDLFDHFRSAEEHDLTVEFYLQRHPVDTNGDANGPVGELLLSGYRTASHEVLARRDVAHGGAADAGVREFIYASGARPVSATLPGDPAAAEPIAAEAEYAAEKIRQYIVSQPASNTTLTVSSTDAGDTVDVIIDSEDAATSETVTLPGNDPNEVTTTASFGDIDAVYAEASHAGDIQVSDGTNDLLAEPLVGTNTDGVEAERGVPPLGTGSHASAIDTDPEEYVFLGTEATFDSGPLAASPDAGDRVHALDVTVEADVQREARQGTRRQVVDVGTRTVTVDADLAGPYETATQNARYFTGVAADLVYTLPDGTITVANATVTDTDDVDRQAGEAGLIYSATYEGHGSPAVTATNTS